MKQGRILSSLLVMTGLIISAGCATLSKDECLNANWYSIGFEDGVKGRSANWQAKHRQACSEYKVNVDVDQYLLGREKGLQRYCIPKNGYWVGKSGGRYAGVCSSQQEPAFLGAYKYGVDVYRLTQRRAKLLQHIKTIRYDLDHYESRILDIENKLIKAKLSRKQKRRLLDKMNTIQVEQQNAIIQLEHLIHDAGLMDEELFQMKRNNPYTF